MKPLSERRRAEKARKDRRVEIALETEAARALLDNLRANARFDEAADVEERLNRGAQVKISVPPDEAMNYAVGLHRTGDRARAQTVYRDILAAEPDHPRALHFLGVAAHQEGRTQEALALIERSMKAYGGEAWAWNNLGNVFKDMDRFEEAQDAYREALALDPEHAEAWVNLGAVYRNEADWDEADRCYARAIEIRPDFFDAWYNRAKLQMGRDRMREAVESLTHALTLPTSQISEAHAMLARAYAALGEREKAVEIYRQWKEEEPDNPVVAHMLAAYSGEPVAKASEAYVAAMFDQFANSFDSHLRKLGYRAPKLVADALIAATPAKAQISICDAGCGTGLIGPLLREKASRLVGVDLSAGMVDKARARGLYDELRVGDLTEFLKSRPGEFDAVISADTLNYFGDLASPFAAAFAALKPGGVLLLTLEAQKEEGAPDHQLQPHGRFAHRRDYAEKVLREKGFAVEALAEEILRKEAGKPVAGYLVTARRSA